MSAYNETGVLRRLWVRWATFVTAVLISTGCSTAEKEEDGGKPFALEIRGAVVWVEIARTEQQRARGLMFRKKLPENAGMLFVYDNEDFRRFWMKNTYIPLSLAYIDSEGVIFQIEEMEPLDETPVASMRPARFVLEVNRGWFRKHGIGIGDRISNLAALYRFLGMEK
ncbi:MAG: DUF192 domain-containing protein [Planctomycetota bacterium]|nr:MAG: DUF192 domain-containing protein [Planctomycetota bacterium]